ncbi:putative ribosomal protein L11 domain superfamily [Helianthus annuus]|nr:putative ribosomal protein L11 domain superfamily [Helianthus annuus]
MPSAAALVIKAFKEPERDRKKVQNIKHSGNIYKVKVEFKIELTYLLCDKIEGELLF